MNRRKFLKNVSIATAVAVTPQAVGKADDYKDVEPRFVAPVPGTTLSLSIKDFADRVVNPSMQALSQRPIGEILHIPDNFYSDRPDWGESRSSDIDPEITRTALRLLHDKMSLVT